MKPMRSSQPLYAKGGAKSLITSAHGKSRMDSRLSRPETTTTKPSLNYGAASNIRFSKTRAEEDLQNPFAQRKGKTRSATAGHNRGLRQRKKTWQRPSSIISSLQEDAAAPSVAQTQPTKVDMQSASRVTFNESAKNEADFKDSFNEVPQMNAAQRKKLRNNFSRRVNQIREKCSLVLDLDVDDMIDANHKLGWGLPEGFLEHAQISNFNPFKD